MMAHPWFGLAFVVVFVFPWTLAGLAALGNDIRSRREAARQQHDIAALGFEEAMRRARERRR
jgi:hypothetical protein